MDTDDRAHLQVRCTRLERVLLAIERALDDRTLAAGNAERLRLTACQERRLAELGGINARLSALRDSAAPT
jgi:hypothetical protein